MQLKAAFREESDEVTKYKGSPRIFLLFSISPNVWVFSAVENSLHSCTNIQRKF